MKQRRRIGQAVFPAAVVFVVAMMVIPLPAAVLDLLLTLNIALAVLLLLASMNVNRALDLSSYPSLLLVATLFRLGLNVSSTRLILSKGDAGHVIEAFGTFVIQGSLIVGMVIFLILVVIQFVVITNGANRVAEVAARFTLDAMPGKQMAIDADLNAGIINDLQAKKRREDVSSEADFYGAMDGASKFVKGDAIAAIIMIVVNLVGGLLVGVLQMGMSVGDAVNNYSLLTVGDGLVSQISALLVSISSGLIVTRAAGESDLGSDVFKQFARQHRALRTAGGAMCLMALVPGLPKFPFLAIGLTSYFGGRYLSGLAVEEPEPEMEELAAALDPDDPNELARSMRVEPIGLELAVDLVDLVDPSVGGDLLDRVKALRRKLALELGVVIPPVRTRDNVDLGLGLYVVSIHGVEVGRGMAPAGHVLVIADDLSSLPGEEVREAVFGLPAKWIPVELRSQAEYVGGTVVDRASVITTHLAELARRNAGELLSRQDVKALVEMLRDSDPAVVEDLNASQVGVAEIQRVLQDLLAEQVPVRDLVRILEVLSEKGRHTRDPESLVEASRTALGATICASRASDHNRLPVITIDPLIEQGLLGALQRTDAGSFLAIDADLGARLSRAIVIATQNAEQLGDEPVLVCAPPIRSALRRFTSRIVPHVPVLSYEELAPQFAIHDLGAVTLD